MGSQAKTSEPQHEFACSEANRPTGQEDKEESHHRAPLTNIWLGLAAETFDHGRVNLGFACCDVTYTMESAVDVLSNDLDSHSIEDSLIGRIGSCAR